MAFRTRYALKSSGIENPCCTPSFSTTAFAGFATGWSSSFCDAIRRSVFRFASLQSPLAARILARHGADAQDLDTVYVVLNADAPEESLLVRSDAVLFVLTQLGGLWRALALVLKLLPHSLRDFGYNIIARRRYRIFGRSETCILPAPENRDRFLDL